MKIAGLKIAIIGLGYVGLPLAVEFGKKVPVVGFDIYQYESTVYPGATEEVCIPVLEKVSGLKFNQDFFAGYSPERINPGDKQHRVTNILKITSGSTPEVADYIDEVYNLIIEAGTHKANTQRDVNIALINELALIFNKLDIDTEKCF